MKESVRAEQFLCVKHLLQYVNGHAGMPSKILILSDQCYLLDISLKTFSDVFIITGDGIQSHSPHD